RLPFDGASTADVFANILRAEVPPLTRRDGAPLPPRLAAIVERALAKDREARYRSARELLDDLKQLLRDLEREPSAIVGTEEARNVPTEDHRPLPVLAPSNLPHPLT